MSQATKQKAGNISRFLPRLTTAIATFIVGIAISLVWMVHSFSGHQPPDLPHCTRAYTSKIETEYSALDAFFPPGVFSTDTVQNQLIDDWATKVLVTMKEPSLLSLNDCNGESYRLLLLHTHYPPISVRIWRSGNTSYLVVKQLDGKGGNEFGGLKIKEARPLAESEWNTFQNLLNQASYWTLPELDTTLTKREDILHYGSLWIIEGVNERQYHVAERWSPLDKDYRACGEYLLKISGLKIEELNYKI